MSDADDDSRTADEASVASSAARDEIDDILREIARASEALPEAADLVGRTLGRFTVVARLGAGGMGVVYRAHDPKLGRDVALKVLSPSLARDDNARARLLREARAAARIQHANVATVYDVGEDGDVSFIALELVEGLNLRDRMRRLVGLPVQEVRTIARGVAAALAAAHTAGVVHRDLKPDNIVLTHTAGVKVLDFGLARRLDDDGAGKARRLTREGEVLGTVGYLSPEQALGRTLDARSDVFSFGVLLFEMLSGRLPFQGSTWGEAAVALERDAPVSLRDLRDDATEPLIDLVDRCLARAPADRPADGAALVQLLARTSSSSGLPGGVPPSGSRRRAHAAPARASLARRGSIALALVLLVVAGVFVGSRWSSWWGAPEPVSLASIPSVSDDVVVQRAFRVAVQSFYAGDMPAAARGLDEVLAASPNSVAALALRLLTGHPESGGHTREHMLSRLESAARTNDNDDERALAEYLAALWRRMNVDAEGQSISSDVSSMLDGGDALLRRRPDDYFADLLVTAALPTSSLDERITRIDALLAQDSGPAVVWLWKIWTLQRGNAADEAGRVLREALRLHPGNRPLRRERGIVASLQRDFDLAEAELRRVLREDPTDTYARIELAAVLLSVGKEDEWRHEIEVVLEGPGRAAPAGRAVLSSVTELISRGRFKDTRALVERAFTLLHEAKRLDVAASFLAQRAREELLVGRADGVRAWLEEMEELIARPELDDGARRRLQGDRLRFGAAIDLLENDVTAARQKAERLLALSDDHFPPDASRERTGARIAARLAAKEGDLERARDAFEQAFDGGPRHARDDEEALVFLATLHRDAGDDGGADSLYGRALALRSRCEERVLWWESLCRMHLAEAAVSRAELARERRDKAAARAHLDELDDLWPRPDPDLPLVERARAVERALRARGSGARARRSTQPP